MELRSFGSDAQDGLAETEDAMGGALECLGGWVIGAAGDDDLQGMMSKERRREAVGGGEETVLRGDACKGFERLLRAGVIAVVAREGVEAYERDRGDGIGAGRGGILKGFSAHIEAAHRSSVRGTIEETAAFGVSIAGDGEVHRAQGGFKVSRLERGFEGIEQGENTENLIVKRTIERKSPDAMTEAAGFGPDFAQHAIEGLQGERAAILSE